MSLGESNRCSRWKKVEQISCRMGPPRLAKLPEKSGLTIWFMVDIAIVNGGYFMVYKSTLGTILWETLKNQRWYFIGGFFMVVSRNLLHSLFLLCPYSSHRSMLDCTC